MRERKAFVVVIASTGQRIEVAASQSVTAALEAQGVSVPMTCHIGYCGTCRTGILAGVPDHWDDCLRPKERERGNVFTPCCSRALTPELVLDL